MKEIQIERIKNNKKIEDLIRFGIINIDKPSGPTSYIVSSYVRTKLNINKTSHLGTLDPMVSGVLPIALGRACRLNDYLMHRDKTYVGIMRLHKEVNENKLKEEISKYIGKIKQLPPVRSSVKRAVREREIKNFEILEIDGKDVMFSSKVQAGTYIRRLCEDIGKEIGGAHMLELRRISAGNFEETESYSLYDFEKAVFEYQKGKETKLWEMILPGEFIALMMPVLRIEKSFLKKCLTGSPLFKEFLEKGEEKNLEKLENEENFCVFCKEAFVGVYKTYRKDRIIGKPEFVLQ